MFRAEDSSSDRIVAVKAFHLDVPPERVHKFVAELDRLLTAGLALPTIPQPLATGIEGQTAYLAEEYVAADSLDIVVRDHGPAPAVEALRIAAQVAGALDFAAVVSVHHGALHPRDVLIGPDETRVTGLGIAQALERIGLVAPVRRPYSAPERIAGGTWDRRADTFGLAALMHELLWGRRVAGSGAQVAGWLTDITGGDLDRLRSVFARALADDPAERYGTALEFVAALKDAFPDLAAGAAGAPGERRKRGARTTSGKTPTLPLEPEPADGPAVAAPSLDDMPIRPMSAEAADVPAAPPVAGDRSYAREAPDLPVPDAADLRAAEEARFTDVEVAPAVVPTALIDAGGLPSSPPPAVGPRVDSAEDVALDAGREAAGAGRGDVAAAALEPPLRHDAPPAALIPPAVHADTLSALERSRSAMWPLVVALIVGLGLGFAGGYGVGLRDRAVAVPPSAAVPAASTRTPVAVPDEPPLASASANAPVPSAPPPARVVTATPARPTPAPAAPPAPRRAPATGRLSVRSTPAGAQVVVDGREFGRTPATIDDLAHGAHRVRIVHDGYVTEERRVVLSERRPAQTLRVQLVRARASQPPPRATSGGFRGELSVDSKPSGAKVYVDGRLVGTTPLVLPQVDAGSHAVRLEYDGYRRWTASVRVVAGERNRLTASLEK